MNRLRLLVLVAGTGTLLAGLPASAAARTLPLPPPGGSATGESTALQLLAAAARATRARTYSGTQYISTWHADAATSSVADIRHTPATGSVVRLRATVGDASEVPPTDTPVTLSTDLDLRLLRLLADNYDLAVAPDALCAGRLAHVVEARRPDVSGPGEVAGRFWLDAGTDLVLRREVFDQSGRLVRSSAFTELTVAPAGGPAVVPVAAVATGPAPMTAADLDQLRRAGWQAPTRLPGDLELYDARIRSHQAEQVLHLSYSDGLSTLSLFAQRGRLGAGPLKGFRSERLAGSAVWVRPSTPERVVWAGGGRVFTLLSDASPGAIRAAVAALPHDKPARTGLLARLERGLARLGSWLNPFN